jgi:phosphoribosylamine--glycine ligase
MDEPLAPLLAAAAAGELGSRACPLAADCVVAVVVSSRGYPDSSESDCVITGIDEASRVPGVEVYHAGTAVRDGQLVTAGGRVLTVVGRGPAFADAIARAYAGVLRIHFDGMQFRHDIGRKALQIAEQRAGDRR